MFPKFDSDLWQSARRSVFVFTLFAFAVVILVYGVPPQSAQEDGNSKIEPVEVSLNGSFENYYTPDNVTAAVRDKKSTLVSVNIRNESDRQAAGKLGTVVNDYGTFVVVAANGRNLSESNLDVVKLETTINLPSGSFEPVLNPPDSTVTAESNLSGKDYYVLQLAGPTNDEWLDSLRANGIEILQYVPHQAFFVYGDAEAIRKAANNSRVRWIGHFTAAEKISPVTLAQLNNAKNGSKLDSRFSPLEMTGDDKSIFDVAIFARANMAESASTIASYFGGNVKHQINLPNNYFNIIRVELNLASVDEAAKLPGVIRIDPYFRPRAEDERAAQIISGNYTNATTINAPGYNPLTQFGVNGLNVTVAIVDDGVAIPGNGGFYVTANNTVNGPLRGAAAGANGHGHLQASIIAGDTPFSPTLDPTGYNYGSGIAPKAHTINIPLLRTGYTGVDADLANDTVTTAGPNGVMGSMSNNSWGAGTNGNSYDALAASYDGFVRDASTAGSIDPLLILFSAGNSGASGLTRPKVAKNVISTASSENLRTELDATANNMEDISSFSSRGPAADTRVKPDITAPGQAITGGQAGPDTLFGNIGTDHRWSSGTSHAVPQITGAAALFTQFWKNGHSNQNPSPALVKAALINATVDMTGTSATAGVPNGAEGWGRIFMKNMLNSGTPTFYLNQEDPISETGESRSGTFKVADASKPVRFTFVWTDPPGTGNPALVNDLDFEVTVGGNTYKGNVFTNGVSTPGGSADNRNNVENVFLPAGIPANSVVTVRVKGTAINGDGILGNADTTDQHFAVVGYNVTEVPIARPFDYDDDGRSDVALWRPTTGVWYIIRSNDNSLATPQFGSTGDRIVPGDYDSDGKVDVAVWRPTTGVWYVLRSSNNAVNAYSFGLNGDVPDAADFDGDGTTDIGVFRPSNGNWYYLRSSSNFTSFTQIPFGSNGDVPTAGDYDGDGKADLAVFRPSQGNWYILRSTDSNAIVVNFGLASDKPVVGDYDGDGKADIAVWRPSTGVWYALKSGTSNTSYTITSFGANGDIPVAGDYDGDGRFDQAVFRPTQGIWYLNRSTSGSAGLQFGTIGDMPAEAAYVPLP